MSTYHITKYNQLIRNTGGDPGESILASQNFIKDGMVEIALVLQFNPLIVTS